jgi:predicted ribosomally synthesized peptide with nif11-like leader
MSAEAVKQFVAKEEGFEITADDYKAYLAEQAGGELTDEDLENVAGGGCGVYVDFCKGKD